MPAVGSMVWRGADYALTLNDGRDAEMQRAGAHAD